MSNSGAICHYILKWDLHSGQQNPNYSQLKKKKITTNTSGKRINEPAF